MLQQLALDEGAWFPAVRDVLNCFYIDDVFFGGSSPESARQLARDLTALLARGNFTLHKWACNRQELAHKGVVVPEVPVELRTTFLENTKVLGVVWSPALDAFELRFEPVPDSNGTKRLVLSQIARLFDPLGWVAAVLIRGKLLMQDLWLSGIDWNDALTWRSWRVG
ncbi:hypothetical protein KM043_016935 [Ampulex compressa]|nr:hypothetical protein KM043_016935 [Ampulex compressa]